jgi:hypothetical protein
MVKTTPTAASGIRLRALRTSVVVIRAGAAAIADEAFRPVGTRHPGRLGIFVDLAILAVADITAIGVPAGTQDGRTPRGDECPVFGA